MISDLKPCELVYHRVMRSNTDSILLEATLSVRMAHRHPSAASMRFAAKFVYNAPLHDTNLLSSLPPHRNVNVCVGRFMTKLPDIAFYSLPLDVQESVMELRGGVRVRRQLLLVLLRYHPLTLDAFLSEHCPPQTPLQTFYRLAVDVLSAYEFFEEHHMVHLKAGRMSTMLDLSDPGSPCLITADFSTTYVTDVDGSLAM